MNHYETLNIKPDATPDEIKSAYRAKANETHPDKGGDAAEFAPVATAYKTLIDPELRLLYDTTGSDKRTPIEVEVQNILMAMFNDALAQDGDFEMLAYIKKKVDDGGKQIPVEVKRLKDRQKKLTKKRGKITSKGVNLFQQLCDAELRNIDGQLANLDHQSVVHKAVVKAIREYKEDWEKPTPRKSFQTIADLLQAERQANYATHVFDPFRDDPFRFR